MDDEGREGSLSSPMVSVDVPPPLSFRSRLFHALYASKLSLLVNVMYAFLVVADGAFFFFMLVGLHAPMDEEDKKWWLNWSIQVLCGLFSYPAVINAPWIILAWSRHKDKVGSGFDSVPVREAWFHLSVADKSLILTLKTINVVAQYVNQWTRIGERQRVHEATGCEEHAASYTFVTPPLLTKTPFLTPQMQM